MTPFKAEPLCSYRYDPLDRLASRSSLRQADRRSFYCLKRLTTEIQDQVSFSWLHTSDRLLAQQFQASGDPEVLLIATEVAGSVIHALGTAQKSVFAYMPYGTRCPVQAHLPGFNGEQIDSVTGHYMLGNGYRAFNPVLMRFNSPDTLSPFGKGGLNAYAYCAGDPVNRIDSTGHAFQYLRHAWTSLKARLTTPKTVIHFLGTDAVAYNKPFSDGKVLDLMGHSSFNTESGAYLMRANRNLRLTPEALLARIKDAKIDISQYDRVRLIMCHSATGADRSFAAQLSRLVKKPVTGHVGNVQGNIAPPDFRKYINEHSKKIRQRPDNRYQYTGKIKIYKTPIPEDPLFNYQPVTFRPPA